VSLSVRQRLKLLIPQYWDEHSELRHLKRVPGLGGWLFVVDTRMGSDFVRVLASYGAGERVTQQSAMSLMRPERLIYHYERLMALAFAFATRSRSALLIGLGGGAMLRYVGSAFPKCRTTVVERETAVVDIARRFFRVDQEIIEADALDFVAESEERFDVVMVDIYDANGFSLPGSGFWKNAVKRLAPGGVMAVNWADFVGHDIARTQSAELARLVRHSLFMTPSGMRDNLVQFASNKRLPEPEELAEGLPTGASRMQRPRSTLGRCIIAQTWPE
jgi:spermidine synthase